MDFVKVLDWFKELNRPERPIVTTVDGDVYGVKADGTLGEPVFPVPPVAKPVLQLSTLTGLVAAYNADVDDFDARSAVQVESYNSVALVSLKADIYGRRHVWARAVSKEVNPFKFEEYLTPEVFLILAQASFMPLEDEGEHYVPMLKLCSSLSTDSSITVADDGFSQKVTVSVGGVKRGDVVLPPRLHLRPYRTFREIDPVQSDFLLRFKSKQGEMPTVTLIPVDAGRWKTDTAEAVGAWLRKRLPEDATVIA